VIDQAFTQHHDGAAVGGLLGAALFSGASSKSETFAAVDAAFVAPDPTSVDNLQCLAANELG
jgi:hypothetical protein